MAYEKILVIDDDPDVHEAVKLILEPFGYVLMGRRTGPEGLLAARQSMPDVILLDVMLATPSEGFHLAYELRRDERLSKIPIIMISSIGETTGFDYAKELGSEYMPVEKFLDKPLTSAKVLDAVQDVLALGRR